MSHEVSKCLMASQNVSWCLIVAQNVIVFHDVS